MDLRGKRAYADIAFRWLVIGAASLVLLILAYIALAMAGRALPVLRHMGLIDFIVSKRWSPADQLYGALPFIWGTVFTAAIAVVIAVPISLGVALFVTQIAPRKLRMPIVYVMDLLAVVPSVVFGLWGVMVLSQHWHL
jgi:phosphate transport system permease protein